MLKYDFHYNTYSLQKPMPTVAPFEPELKKKKRWVFPRGARAGVGPRPVGETVRGQSKVDRSRASLCSSAPFSKKCGLNVSKNNNWIFNLFQ